VSNREVYPNAPLALVAVEVRFPDGAAASLSPAVHRAVRDRLGGNWVIEGGKQQTMEVAFGAAGVAAPNVRSENVSRITVRDRTQVVTARQDSLTIEATRYGGYEAFRELIHLAFAAVEDLLEPDGMSRLGLRYINEISIPADDSATDWAQWVHESLLPPSTSTLAPATWTGAVQYDIGKQRHLVLRYGPADQPFVAPTGPLRRLRVPKGQIFVLDFDSYWQPEEIPAFSADSLLQSCDDLRAPVHTLFTELVSDRLVSEVFRVEPER
jgi:uncharacterized protein (TIGR04255 family)